MSRRRSSQHQKLDDNPSDLRNICEEGFSDTLESQQRIETKVNHVIESLGALHLHNITSEIKPKDETGTVIDAEQQNNEPDRLAIKIIGDIHYICTEKLGDGSLGTTVYKGQFKGQDIAVKRGKKDVIKVKEIEMLLQVSKHENIVEYYHSECDVEYYYLAFQLCLTSLEKFIKNEEKRGAILRNFAVDKKKILCDAVRGLKHLHKQHIVHRDVKPSNILLVQRNSSSMEIKAVISDFGIATELEIIDQSETTSNLKGTIIWIAPELLSKLKYSSAVDIFSMGCVMYYILSDGQHPFGNDMITIVQNFGTHSYTLDGISDEVEDRETAKHLIEQMIHKDKESRISIKKVLSHCYFWSKEKQLEFLEAASDFLDSTKDHIIEHDAADVIGANWTDQIHTKDIPGNYNAASVKDLLRVIKAKIQNHLVSVSLINCHFPKLLIHVYKQMASHEALSHYYQSDDAGNTQNLARQIVTLIHQLEVTRQELATERELRKKAEHYAEKYRRKLERMEIEQVESKREFVRIRRQLEENERDRAQVVQSYCSQLQEKDKVNEEILKQVQKYKEKEAKMKQKLQKHRDQYKTINIKLQEKDIVLQRKDIEQQEKDMELQEKNMELQEKDRQHQVALQEKDRELQEKDRQHQVALQEKDRELQEKDRQHQVALQEKDRELQENDRELQEKDEELCQSQETIHRYQQQACALTDDQFDRWVINKDEVTLTDEELGRGAYGFVTVGIFRGLRVAVKSLHIIIISDYNLHLFSREMSIASRVRHPNLVQFIGATKVGNPLILTELMSTSLNQELGKKRLTNEQILSIAQDVALGLNYLHLFKPQPIIHRDVSSPNVLLKPSAGAAGYEAKVADYGTAKVVEAHTARYSYLPGNPAYAAPEALFPDQHNPAMDVYSYSVLLMEMNLCCPPEMTTAERARQSGSVSWSDMKSLIQRGLNADPRARSTMAQVIESLKRMKT